MSLSSNTPTLFGLFSSLVGEQNERESKISSLEDKWQQEENFSCEDL